MEGRGMTIPSLSDMLIAIRDSETAGELRATWDGIAMIRPDMPDHDRIRLMEIALSQLLTIEARHEGDNR